MEFLEILLKNHAWGVTLLAMMEQGRRKFRIDWTIPATWIIGMALMLLANAVVVIVKGKSIITAVEGLVIAQEKFDQRLEKIRLEQVKTEVELGRQKQVGDYVEQRMNFLFKRIERNEADIKDRGYRGRNP